MRRSLASTLAAVLAAGAVAVVAQVAVSPHLRAGRGRRGRAVHLEERPDRRRRLRPRHRLQPDRAEPDLRPHRHRRRLPLGPVQPVAGSRCWTGSAGTDWGYNGVRQPRHRPGRHRTGCTRRSACTPTTGTRTTARSCAPPTGARPGRRTALPFKLGGNMPGRGMGERLAVDPNQQQRPLLRRAERQRPVAQHRLTASPGRRSTSFPNAGNYAPGPERHQRLPQRQPGRRLGRPSTRAPAPRAAPPRRSTSAWPTRRTPVYRSHRRRRDLGSASPASRPATSRTRACSTPSAATSTSPPATPAARTTAARATCGGSTPATGAWTQHQPDPVQQRRRLLRLQRADHRPAEPGHDHGRHARSPGGRTRSSSAAPTAARPGPGSGTAPATRTGPCATRWTSRPSPWLTFGSQPAPPEVTPKLGWMTESLEIDPFDSNRMMYGTGATIYGTDNLTELGHRRHSSPSGRWCKGLEETAVLDLISPPSGAPAGQRARRHRRLPAHRPRRRAADDVHPARTSPRTTSLDFAERNPSVDGAGRQLHRRRPAGRQPRRASPPTAAPTGSRAPSPPASTAAARSRPRPTAAASSGRPATPASRCVYSVGFGNSWTAVQRHPGRRRSSSPTGSTRRSSTASPAAGSTSAPTAARPSPPPPRPGCRPAAACGSRRVPGRRGRHLAGRRHRRAYGLWHSTDSGATFTKLSNVTEADQRRLRQGGTRARRTRRSSPVAHRSTA